MIVVGGGAAGYLLWDVTHKSMQPETGNTSLLRMAANTVAQTVASADVPTVKTGMPTLTRAGDSATLVDSPTNTNANLLGISELCKQILCNNVGSGDTAATFASCECQTGNLANNCYNASLFNIHWRAVDNMPRVRIGTEIMPSFTTGRSTQVEAFRASIQHFKAWCERNSPNMLAAIRANDLDAFQVALGQSVFNSTYSRTIQNGQILPGRNFIRQRYNRLKSARLL